MGLGHIGLLMRRSLSTAATFREAALGNAPQMRTLRSWSYSKHLNLHCKPPMPPPSSPLSSTCMPPSLMLPLCFLCWARHQSCFHKICLHQPVLPSHEKLSVANSCVVSQSDWTSQNYSLNIHITTPVNVFSLKCIDFFLWNQILYVSWDMSLWL